MPSTAAGAAIPPLTMLSKSTWAPAIRREHALASKAAERGHRVRFIERPADVRSIRSGATARRWARLVASPESASFPRGSGDRITVVPSAVLAPGHRGRALEALEACGLRRSVGADRDARRSVVVTVPWRWAARTAQAGARHVFDCADDWSDLLPRRQRRMRDAYARIGQEADEVIVVREDLRDLFGGRPVTVVPNGVDDRLVAAARQTPARPRTMAYSGTFTDRFDGDLVSAVLERLPDWSIDLYGQCQYAGAGERPGGALARLLERHPGRARWHGVVGRDALADALDGGSVLVVPHLPNTAFGGSRGWGGDVMKLYDYAARGTPIVSTGWSDDLRAVGPPGLRVADDGADAFCELVESAEDEADAPRRARTAWAAEHSWERRWPAWAGAVWASAGTGT